MNLNARTTPSVKLSYKPLGSCPRRSKSYAAPIPEGSAELLLGPAQLSEDRGEGRHEHGRHLLLVLLPVLTVLGSARALVTPGAVHEQHDDVRRVEEGGDLHLARLRLVLQGHRQAVARNAEEAPAE